MRKSILSFVLFFILTSIPLLLFAQGGYLVRGHIISAEDNEPMIGVSVLEKGTTNGVITDINGNYSITVTKSPAILQFSYVGMQTVERNVTVSTRIDLKLESNAQQMDEVVVVAYGVRKKGTIAGSVSTVKAEKMENVPAASFDQALQGQAPGLMVMAVSGEPSVAASFQIRGVNSLSSGTSPLFILDGVPVSSADFNTLNPSDIESVSVLKDASSTSIYGARAANGVVVITTRRGLALDKAKVTFRTQLGISQLAQEKWTQMNTAERILFEKEVGLDKGKDYNLLRKTDINWMDAVFNDRAVLQNYEVSVNRATDRLNYYVSGNFFDQDGIALGSGFRRYNMRANADVKASNWLKVGTTSTVSYEEIEQAQSGEYTTVTPISASHFMMPYWNPYREDGSIASSGDGSWTGTTQNPIEWMNSNPVKYKKYKLLSTLYAEVNPFKGFVIRSQFAADYSHMTAFMQSFPSYPANNNSGRAGRSSTDRLGLTITNTANYQFSLKDKHSFNFLLGQEGVDANAEGFSLTMRGQNNDLLTNVSNGTLAASWSDTADGTVYSYSYLSFFGRGEYNYEGRYYADFSLRTDASSRFGRDNRWGTFWSVGLMWDIQKENFMKKYDWLTMLQVAFSTGTSGNSEIGYYASQSLVKGGMDYMGETGLYPSQNGNPDLSWEQTWSTNLALHLGFWNRVNMDVELYNKKTTNMLMSVPQSYSVNGSGSYWDNIGAMVNRGAEISINGDVIRAKDFTWNVSANVSYNKNKITDLYHGVDEYEVSSTNLKYVVGRSATGFYINCFAGVNPANGDALWYTKDGEITTEFKDSDKVMTGKSFIAPWQGGLGTALTWKGISLVAQFSWVAGRWVFNNDRYLDEGNGLFEAYNQSKRLLYDRWKKPGDMTDIPRYGVTPQMDSRFLEDASFIRLKNLMVSYSFPRTMLKKTNFLTNLRVYAQGQNLLTFTKFSGLDPEGVNNMYQAQYPSTRQFTFGLEVSF